MERTSTFKRTQDAEQRACEHHEHAENEQGFSYEIERIDNLRADEWEDHAHSGGKCPDEESRKKRD